MQRIELQSSHPTERCMLEWPPFQPRNTDMHTPRQLLASLAFTTAVLGAVGSATAQIYPTRPITMIVPLAAGGPTDTLARTVAERMRVSLRQPVLIENVTG